MSSGIVIPALPNIFAAFSNSLDFSSDPINGPGLQSGSGPWTPPQYSEPALTILTVQSTTNNSTGEPASPQVNYIFDAVFRLLHRRRVHKTSHPVLTGANISDHAYVEPAQLSLEIGMSDAMAAFISGVWVGASTKSISAWQVMKSLQISKTLFTVSTRLDTYSNMMILDGSATDDNRTKNALRATFVLEELLSASVVSITAQSARPQTSGSTSNGTVQGIPPNAAQVQQNVIPSALYPDAQTYPQIPGAGDVSSNSLSMNP
jgi:Dit-like tail protein